jgi:MoxR-like ATPase
MDERVAEALQTLRHELTQLFVERDEFVDGALAALLARQHVLLIGPPGSGKSTLVHALCERIPGASYFHWLLTKFTTPEELFGPVSLQGLEQDRYYRVTHGKLPRAHIAFLDEIFKANSAILNACSR